MTRMLALVFLAFAACDGIPMPESNPDAALGSPIDSGVAPDAIPTTGEDALPPTTGPCGPGYTLAHYSNPGTWCAPATDAGGAPCAYGNPINWAGGGIVRCPTADGGQP